MNDDNGNDKGNQPDYIVNLVQQDKNGDDQWTRLGVGWDGKKGYITGETIAGKFVLQPRKELERLRSEREQSDNQDQSQDLNQEF